MIENNHYTITAERLPVHELIGLNVRILASKDASRKGFAGKVVDETQKMFTIETANGEVRVPKNECSFSFDLGGEEVRVEGKNILYTPVERLKSGWGAQ